MIVLQTGNFTLELPSMPADFGPEIPPTGVSGLLAVADPADGCEPLVPPQWAAHRAWVALIARSQDKEGCTFDVKVAHAEGAGAVAAVVYDDVYEPLILMAKDPRHPDPGIPAAFVTQRSGIMMRRLMVEGKTVVTLTPLTEALWLSMIMSACAGFLAVNVVLGALWVMRRQRVAAGLAAGYGPLPPRQGMTAAEIRALPMVVYEEPTAAGQGASSSRAGREEAGGGGEHGAAADAASDSGSDSGRKGGGTRSTCAICLDNYASGDKLLVLPCNHRYHRSCISEWLGNRRPVCPVCKADARASSMEADVEGGGSSNRRTRPETFLLRMGASWFAVRRHFGRRGSDGSEIARRGGRAAAAAAESGEQAGARQLLLGGSRASTPIPTHSAPQQAETETAATLANFPHLFPASASSSRAAPSSVPEIEPADASSAFDRAGPRGAEDAMTAGGSLAARQRERVASPPRPCPPRLARPVSDSCSSSAASAAGSQGRCYAAPDSTEGSETESEME
ncbi:receptor homology transmembrane domain- and RING domain-containing 1-like isoform X1 [Chlorella sorokiniana]|uniref:Receptor homology transmembrane domain-and RING domain-containing 1-like isoform X1 n=1 Tax=Chlorella sorokiniana TaxID=3076 RepID=A0A2P6U5D2_CHLSO|nr:receptor homology transmembrane domain- and RING domain-containing 1-like isoform X1 [Chlorella sorokiniana]|eukprot:PRW61507.1 receptor homology transmembrane domain- and RING domain-containing 1-like isoform X1 [Chlorella sorokiniana]